MINTILMAFVKLITTLLLHVHFIKCMYECVSPRLFVLCCQLIVATTPEEALRLDKLHERGIKNNVPDLKVVGPDEIKEIEPNCKVIYARIVIVKLYICI